MKQAYSRYGMVFAFLCVVGGGAYAGGPITYPARTDTCETSNTGPCLNLGMKFLGRPGDPLPTGLQLGLTRSNAVGMDVDFHDKVIRATDATDRNNASIEAEIGTHHWEKDSKMFIVRINNGGYLLRYFNPSLRTVQTSRIISATSGAGDSTHFGRAVSLTFSWTNSGTVYELYGTKINQLTIDQVSDTITSRVLVFDFAHDSFNSGVNCLPSTYVPTWNGLFDVSQDDKSFTVAFYNGAGSGQNNAHDLVNFTSGMGCRYMRTDTFQVVNRDWGSAVGPVMTDQPFVNGNNVFASRCSAAAPCPLYDSFGMHEAAQRHNKQFASFAGDVCSSVAPNYCSCPPTSSNAQLPCQKYYWEIATNFVRPCNNVTDCEGHAAGGSQLDFIGLGGVSHSFSQPNVGVLDSNGVNKGNPGLRTILIAPPVDNHGTYANADSTDQQPFIYTTSGVPSNPFVLNPVPPFTSGYLMILPMSL